MFAKANDEESAVARPLPALRPFGLLLPALSVVPGALRDFFQINAASACDLSVCIFLYRDKLFFLASLSLARTNKEIAKAKASRG